MSAARADVVRRVLHALADLSSSTDSQRQPDAIALEYFQWLPLAATELFRPPDEPSTRQAAVEVDREHANRLAAIQQIRANPTVRVGWLFVAGTFGDGDLRRRVFQPLVVRPVRVSLGGRTPRLVPAGDAQISEIVRDPAARERLEAEIQYGGGALDIGDVATSPEMMGRLAKLRAFATEAARAAGFPDAELASVDAQPADLIERDNVRVIAGAGVFVAEEVVQGNRASALRGWSMEALLTPTAMHSLYLPETVGPPVPTNEPEPGVISALALTPRQHAIVLASRDAPITVIAGAPGTGKSHTIAAIASDAIGRGESVLVAAKSDATVDALIDLLERVPGPPPVVFGSSERRAALVDALSAGAMHPASDDDVERAASELRRESAECHRLFAQRCDALQQDIDLQLPPRDLDRTRACAPLLFGGDADLDDARRLASEATTTSNGWWPRRRARKRSDELRTLVGSAPDAGLDEVVRAVAVATAQRSAASLVGSAPALDDGEAWRELQASYERTRVATGGWLHTVTRSEQRVDARARGAMAALGTALRAGRAARRARLAALGDEHVTHALPLWIGTLADIDDLLPPRAAMFDLVVLDEASAIDQGLAAPAMLRGRRGVIVGDPRQLRHVSFLSDEQIQRVIANFGLDADPLLASRLDVRRNSVFDVAVGVAPAWALDEHWRCEPHLIDFVARRLYDGEFTVATRTPLSQSHDCVELVRVEGDRDDQGVVQAEIDSIIGALRAAVGDGRSGYGVITPFRAQADALEKAALAAFTAEELIALDLRAGTVHQFQGNERDTVYCSLAIGASGASSSWRFAGDPHLLAVMLTRARKRMVVVHAADPPSDNLLRSYFDHADSPPGPPRMSAPQAAWASAVIEDLAAAGIELWRAYPVGRHVVDVATMVDGRPVAVTFGVHPAGAHAHVDRHLTLLGSGWHVIHVPGFVWQDRHGELVVELLQLLRQPSP